MFPRFRRHVLEWITFACMQWRQRHRWTSHQWTAKKKIEFCNRRVCETYDSWGCKLDEGTESRVIFVFDCKLHHFLEVVVSEMSVTIPVESVRKTTTSKQCICYITYNNGNSTCRSAPLKYKDFCRRSLLYIAFRERAECYGSTEPILKISMDLNPKLNRRLKRNINHYQVNCPKKKLNGWSFLRFLVSFYTA